MTETMDPVAHVDRTIADIHATIAWLDEHEWIQGGQYEYANGRSSIALGDRDPESIVGACAFGAACIVTGETSVKPLNTMARSSLIGRAFYRIMGGIDIVTYNDTFGRTKHQMIRALETVASELAKDPSRA